MSLSITNIQRIHGPNCQHIIVTVDHEGTSRQFETSFPDVDVLIDQLGGPQEAMKALVMLWAAYRRRNGRAVLNVELA